MSSDRDILLSVMDFSESFRHSPLYVHLAPDLINDALEMIVDKDFDEIKEIYDVHIDLETENAKIRSVYGLAHVLELERRYGEDWKEYRPQPR